MKKIKAGKYYIGDPCYFDKEPLWKHGTDHGDGFYQDNMFKFYGVDSGELGIMPEDSVFDCTFVHKHTFENDFTPKFNKGVFEFGHIKIDTNWRKES